MKTALVSLNLIWENKEENLNLCKQYIKNSSNKSVDLIIFPEMTLTGFSNNVALTAENYENSESINAFSLLAKKFNIGIVFGVVIESDNKGLNQAIFIDKNGEIIGEYSKVHPFSFAGEDKCFDAGSNLCVIKFMGMNIGLTICYDLRFPELYSGLATKCDLIVNIANWPSKRIEHWNSLLKARAIENQLFIAGVNRIGTDGIGLEYTESSKLFNANGEQLNFEQTNDMKIYEIDKNWTKEFKEKFNTTTDRKIDFYKGIL